MPLIADRAITRLIRLASFGRSSPCKSFALLDPVGKRSVSPQGHSVTRTHSGDKNLCAVAKFIRRRVGTFVPKHIETFIPTRVVTVSIRSPYNP